MKLTHKKSRSYRKRTCKHSCKYHKCLHRYRSSCKYKNMKGG